MQHPSLPAGVPSLALLREARAGAFPAGAYGSSDEASPQASQSTASSEQATYGARLHLRQALKAGDVSGAHAAVDEYFGTWRRVLAASEWRGDELIREVSELRQALRDRDAQGAKRDLLHDDLLAQRDSLMQDVSRARDEAAQEADATRQLRAELAQARAAHAAAEANVAQVTKERDEALTACQERQTELERKAWQLKILQGFACVDCRRRAEGLEKMEASVVETRMKTDTFFRSAAANDAAAELGAGRPNSRFYARPPAGHRP